jgi:hypothetical protein
MTMDSRILAWSSTTSTDAGAGALWDALLFIRRHQYKGHFESSEGLRNFSRRFLQMPVFLDDIGNLGTGVKAAFGHGVDGGR